MVMILIEAAKRANGERLPGRFRATLDDGTCLVESSTVPFCASARKLVELGCDPALPLMMRLKSEVDPRGGTTETGRLPWAAARTPCRFNGRRFCDVGEKKITLRGGWEKETAGRGRVPRGA